MSNVRPNYGNAFEFDRILNVFFYTSNISKLLQARMLFSRRGYQLKHFSGNREPYDEEYALGTTLLLSRAVKQVTDEFGLRSIFFVEDTSVRIECLSRKEDFPGLAIKDWFATTTFSQLDDEIRRRGGNRSATVMSDVALHLPTLKWPLFFHGETKGSIADSAPDFEPSTQYPWLTPNTFNGWLVPEGANKRLGEMEFEESLEFDFRAKSIGSLLDRMEELNAALNVSHAYYTVRKASDFAQGQLRLISDQRNVLMVVGNKCAGKTTFSDHMATRDGVDVFEASSILRGIALDDGKDIQSFEEAFEFLSDKGWDVVARKIAEYIERSTADWIIITGLRTTEELLLLRESYSDSRVILIEADNRIRFERHVQRARNPEITEFHEFTIEDDKQKQFGVMRIANEIADVVIKNEGTISSYKTKIDEALASVAPRKGNISSGRTMGELHKCLWALDQIGRSASCEEIARETARLGASVRVYNTNRALKEVPEFALRIEGRGNLQYRLTPRGAKALNLLNASRGVPFGEASPMELPFS